MKPTPPAITLRAAGLLLILTLALTGCKAAAPAEPADQAVLSPGQNVTLSLEVGQDALITFPTTFYQPNLDAFEKKYPHIQVKLLVIPEKQIKTTLQTKLVSGNPSDIICYNKVSAENELNAMQYFTDLSGEPWVSRLAQPDLLRASNGKIYGYAIQNFPHGLGIVYNTELFKTLNLPVPTSYTELLRACAAIKENGYTPVYAPFEDRWTFQIWTTSAWGYIAERIHPGLWGQINSGEKKWSDIPEFEDTLQNGYSLFKNGYMQDTLLTDDYNSAVEAFSSGKCAMMIGTSDFVTLMQKKAPDLKLDIFPVQAFDFPNPCIAQGQLGAELFIPMNAVHAEEARLFIDFMTQPEQTDRAQAAAAFIPMVKDAAPPVLSEFQQGLMNRYIQSGNTVTEMNAYMKVPLDDLWRLYEEMFMGAKTPEEVLAAWDLRFSELMRERGEPGF